MVNSTLQIVGLLVACTGGLCTIVSTFLPDWRKNDPTGEVLESVTRHQGIWIRCIAYSTGMWQCDDYDAFFLGLPTPLQIARGMSISANLLGFFAFVFAVFGMQCTTCVESNPLIKNRIAMLSAGLWVLSGICIGVAASVFSNDILNDYTRFSNVPVSETLGQRYIFGAALFIGWTGMILCFLGGLVMSCGSCGESHPATKFQRAGVRRVASIGRSVSMSFRRGRPQERNTEYV